MANSDDKTRKRDIFKHGLSKATSKLGFSSQSQAGPSHLLDAMASTVTNSMSVVPDVSQAHHNTYYPTPPVWPHVDNPDEINWRGPLDARGSGPKGNANFDRLGGGSNKDDEDKKKKKKKVEDSKIGPKDDSKKKKSNS